VGREEWDEIKAFKNPLLYTGNEEKSPKCISNNADTLTFLVTFDNFLCYEGI
jgi:hypothetical protein